jgi:hypothetical protein
VSLFSLPAEPRYATLRGPMTPKAVSGDIVVSAFPGGYLIGRVRTPPERDELSWEYISANVDLSAATKFAVQLAERAGVSVWACQGDCSFREIPWRSPIR